MSLKCEICGKFVSEEDYEECNTCFESPLCPDCVETCEHCCDNYCKKCNQCSCQQYCEKCGEDLTGKECCYSEDGEMLCPDCHLELMTERKGD